MAKHDATPFAGMNYQQLSDLKIDDPLYDGKRREMHRRRMIAERHLNAAYTANYKALLFAEKAAHIMDGYEKPQVGNKLTDCNPFAAIHRKFSDFHFTDLMGEVRNTRRWYMRCFRSLQKERADRAMGYDYDIDDDQSIGDYEMNGADRETPQY